MKMKKKNLIPHTIYLQLLASFMLVLNACGETINKEKQMENKENIVSVNSETNTAATTTSTDTITLAGGCFWCVEAVYEMLDGVKSVVSGYSGGQVKNPSYREVCTGLTGHAEAAQITFDTSKTSIEEILKVFFTVHDPTTLNRQGADVGTQYRSAIFFRNDKQEKVAKSIIDDLNREKAYPQVIVTQVVPFTNFYKAEDYHQDYYNQNKEEPYCKMVIQPKLEKFEKVFKDRLKKQN
jgi:methionine-S-sulfoxide reductase